MDADLLALTEALCAIPSVSGNEAALADDVEQRLRRDAPALTVERIGHNVIARTDHGLPTRVVLGGHLDTVPPNDNATPRRDGDTLHGLGTADMKGGLAVLLSIAAGLSDARPQRDVTFVFYEGEEVADEHNGLRRLFAERAELVAGDLAILLEPTGGWVEAGCQGTIHVRATFDGQRAHSARPWMGVNAIHKAAPLLERVAGFAAETVAVDGLDYRESLQVVRVEGGIANNVVPDRCSVVINRRYAPSRSLEGAVAAVRALCVEAGADAIDVVNASPAAPPNLWNPLVAELVGVYNLPVRPKLGWTDVARFAAHGIPALNLGPGDPELAHTAKEFVTSADLEGCAAVLRSLLGTE
ncbi:MAG TPA: succinyl-diaminopimelate desuccinylase [Acidimicrobiia bacterium]|jgi:succinyl-diaminopimelate desuccinylase|nr:succinyl-diaminopimelate desuccinylase [Acidimicrobiia bacterium]